LEALSFTAAATPRAAKNPSPPHSHANASYYRSANTEPIKQPNQNNPDAYDAAMCNVFDQVHTTLPMCGARRSMQGSGKGVPLSHTSSSFTGSCDPKRKFPRSNRFETEIHWAGMRRAQAGVGFGFGLGVRETYGLIGDDVAADGEAHAGAVPEGGGRSACAAAAQDAGSRRG